MPLRYWLLDLNPLCASSRQVICDWLEIYPACHSVYHSPSKTSRFSRFWPASDTSDLFLEIVQHSMDWGCNSALACLKDVLESDTCQSCVASRWAAIYTQLVPFYLACVSQVLGTRPWVLKVIHAPPVGRYLTHFIGVLMYQNFWKITNRLEPRSVRGTWAWFKPVCHQHHTFLKNIARKNHIFKLTQMTFNDGHFVSLHTSSLQRLTYNMPNQNILY